MDLGNLLFGLVRLIHIIAAFAWFGLGLVNTFFIGPASVAAGESGLRFMKALYTRTSLAKVFAAGGGITVLAGIILYLMGARRDFDSLGNIVLAIGAIAGLAAGVHGGAVVSRGSRASAAALEKYVVDNQPISAEGLGVLRQTGMELASHARLSFILMLIALIFMGSARYL